MRPFCGNCAAFMTCEKTGALVCTMDSQLEPYELWSGDRFTCKHCAASVVVGFGAAPVAAAYEEGALRFRQKIAREQETGEVFFEVPR